MIAWRDKPIAARSQRGQVALETLIVLAPWLIMIALFFNLLFMLATLMLNQATVNRGAQQAASLGCLPVQLQEDLTSRSGLGMHDVRLIALTPQVNLGQQVVEWDRDRYLNENGEAVARPGVARYLPDCSRPNRNVESGNYIFVQASYKQRLWVLGGLAAMGLIDGDSVELRTEALTVSNSLEGER